MTKTKFIGILDEQKHFIEIEKCNEKYLYSVTLDDQQFLVNACTIPLNGISILINNDSFDLYLDHKNQLSNSINKRIDVNMRGKIISLEIFNKEQIKIKKLQIPNFLHSGHFEIKSPMPGRIIRFLVKKGEKVTKGQGLAVVEAMKMENELQSPKNGTVKDIIAQTGKSVQADAVLLIIE